MWRQFTDRCHRDTSVPILVYKDVAANVTLVALHSLLSFWFVYHKCFTLHCQRSFTAFSLEPICTSFTLNSNLFGTITVSVWICWLFTVATSSSNLIPCSQVLVSVTHLISLLKRGGGFMIVNILTICPLFFGYIKKERKKERIYICKFPEI